MVAKAPGFPRIRSGVIPGYDGWRYLIASSIDQRPRLQAAEGTIDACSGARRHRCAEQQLWTQHQWPADS